MPTSNDHATGPSRVPQAAVAVLLGVLAVQCLPRLPPHASVAIASLLALVLLWKWPRWRLPALALIGFAWCAWRADLALDARLPRALEGRDFDVVGVLDELPRRGPHAWRFVLRVEHAALDGARVPLRGRIRVSWYDLDPPLDDPCGRWQLRVRLKRPRGVINPGGFDFERHALERGIVATGYVRDDGDNRRIGGGHCVDGLRDAVARGIAARVSDPHDAHLLQAFAVGDTRGLDAHDWDVARANGIPHLIAISGFHVGVAAAFGVLAIRALWWLWPALALRVPARLAEAPAALLVAVGYGFLAGGSLPTVRTLLMIAVIVLARLGRRPAGGAQSLALALLAILAFDPLAVLSAGFWLSFVGVAILMLCLSRRHGMAGLVREYGIAQILMTVSLLPLTAWFFGQSSLVGALSNLVAVPLVSFVIVPLALLGTLALLTFPGAAGVPLAVAGWIVHAQWWLLERMATWPGAHWHLPGATLPVVLLALGGALWWFLPRAVPARALGLLLFLPLLFPHLPRPEEGAFEARIVDVGQGLSVLVRTRDHALLYDAGARYPSGFDLGEAAVLPTLRALGIARLDVLMVSHGDNDHAGGAAAVARAYPGAVRLGGEPARGDVRLSPCRAGQSWHWNGVRLRVLHPAAGPAGDRADNDRSCVLLVEGGRGRLLLTGDIGSRVEPAIASAAGSGPPLVLLVPHHGSRTGSGADFIAALRPAIAVVSAGWRSRFGHPHPEVVARYEAAGVPLFNTAENGALHLSFPVNAAPALVGREREAQARYWRE